MFLKLVSHVNRLAPVLASPGSCCLVKLPPGASKHALGQASLDISVTATQFRTTDDGELLSPVVKSFGCSSQLPSVKLRLQALEEGIFVVKTSIFSFSRFSEKVGSLTPRTSHIVNDTV